MIFESHAHYDDRKFDEDRDKILSCLNENGIEYVVNVGADLKSIQSSVDLAEKYDFVYAAVGVHPSDVDQLNDETFQWMIEKTKNEKVVAIGEIGLDYYWEKEEKAQENQKHWFVRQLDLSKEIKKPVIIHSRDAAKETFDILKCENGGKNGGVIHCFSYSKELAIEYVKMGFYIGIGGVVTFDNAKKLKEAVAAIPLENILLETDCPYLAPTPNRGKRNSSLNIPFIAEEIAKIKGITYEEVVRKTNENAKQLFGIGKREDNV